MKRLIKSLGVFLAITILSSCSSTKPFMWDYQANTYYEQENWTSKSLVIKPFIDEREGVNKNKSSMAYIPGIPFGWQNYSKPEDSKSHLLTSGWEVNPSKDFAKSLEKELETSNISPVIKYSESDKDADFIIEGIIKKSSYKSKTFSYCVSPFYGFLWYLGAPAFEWQNEIELTLVCKDNRTGSLLFKETYHEKFKKLMWLYTVNSDSTDFEYDYLLKQIYKKFVEELKESKVIR